MSYIRPTSPYRFVKGFSNGDYVYCSQDSKGKEFIEEYNGISDDTLVELICREISTEDYTYKEWLTKKIAERLKVELRKKPLTNEQILKIHFKRINQSIYESLEAKK